MIGKIRNNSLGGLMDAQQDTAASKYMNEGV